MDIKQEVDFLEKKLLTKSSTDDMVFLHGVPWSRDTKLNRKEVRHDVSVFARFLINVYAMWPFHEDVIKLKVLKLLNDIYDSATDMTADQLFDEIKKILVYIPDNHLTFSFCGDRLYHDSDREIINVGSNLAASGSVLTELRKDNVAVIAFSGMYKDDKTKQQLLDFREKIDTSCALIIDLRGNGGGNSIYSDDLAYYLCGSMTRSANKMYRRNNPDAKKISQYFAHAAYDYQGDQDPFEIKFEKKKKISHGYQKPIYILIDKYTGSAAEMFLLKMIHNPFVKIVGANSRGMEVCGNKVYITLPKSHIVFYAGTVYRVLEYSDFECNGITPHIKCRDGQNAFDVALSDFVGQNQLIKTAMIER